MRGYYVPPFLRFSCTHGRGGVYATVEARVRGPYTVGGGEWDTIHRAFRREAVGGGIETIQHTGAHEAGRVYDSTRSKRSLPASITAGY